MEETIQSMELAQNYKTVKENVTKACEQAGRSEQEVTLLAVSKTKPVDMLMDVYRAGARDFGENKVQELVDKIPQMPSDVRWHMIGHLQRNKVKYIVDKVYLIHSVDSLRLAEEISREAVKKQVEVNILIEVNVAQEESKFGTTVEETATLIREIATLPGIHIRGLMTIAPFVESSAEQAPETVDIRMNDHMQLMCLGIGDFFRGKCTRLFFCIFSRICCIHSCKTSHIF